MMGLDCDQVIEAFNNWARGIDQEKSEINDHELEWIGMDAKSLVSTLTDAFKTKQNFVSIISGFSQDTQRVIALSKFENKQHLKSTKPSL